MQPLQLGIGPIALYSAAECIESQMHQADFTEWQFMWKFCFVASFWIHKKGEPFAIKTRSNTTHEYSLLFVNSHGVSLKCHSTGGAALNQWVLAYETSRAVLGRPVQHFEETGWFFWWRKQQVHSHTTAHLHSHVRHLSLSFSGQTSQATVQTKNAFL